MIVGAKNKELLILEDMMKSVAGNLYITTDDGSYGDHGMVTNSIQKLYDAGTRYDVCIAIGPMIMMKFVCKLTKELELPTIVSLNPIMVDGTGMCGGCRVTVGDEVKFACVDGPEFDGALVDWDEMFKRMGTFKNAERQEMEQYELHVGGVKNNKEKNTEKPHMDVEPTTESLAELTNREASWRKRRK